MSIEQDYYNRAYCICDGTVTITIEPLERIDHEHDGPHSFKLVARNQNNVIVQELEIEADHIIIE